MNKQKIDNRYAQTQLEKRYSFFFNTPVQKRIEREVQNNLSILKAHKI